MIDLSWLHLHCAVVYGLIGAVSMLAFVFFAKDRSERNWRTTAEMKKANWKLGD